MSDEVNITWHAPRVSREERERVHGHRGCVIWLTGLSGSGKSTLANLVDQMLVARGAKSMVLDGDNVRHGLNASPALLKETYGDDFAARFGLGFTAIDREENIRRIGAVSQLFCESGTIVLTAFISPYRIDRDRIRASMRPGDFIEVFVDTPLEICEQRDPKGLYKRARAGVISHFTGIDDPYEPPLHPDLILRTRDQTPDDLAEDVIDHLVTFGILPTPR
jgi:adenylylsulfate kinase